MGKSKHHSKSKGGWSGLTAHLPFSGSSNGGSTTSPASSYQRCYHTHPAYEIEPGVMIYGGSCISPAVKDADVYIGFDAGMPATPISFPWNPGDEIYFKVTDRDVPQNMEQFQQLLVWTAAQLRAGRKVHAGCIGGHGRTGTFFAALRMHLTGDVNAVEHVRANYCKKAVESTKQVDWLHEHFGMNKAQPTDHQRQFQTPAASYGGGYSKPVPSGSKWSAGGPEAVVVPGSPDAAGSMWAPDL